MNPPQLWLAVHLPLLPLEIYSRGHRRVTPALVAADGRVLCADAGAQRAGIVPGLSLGAARALATGVRVFERSPALEREALERLADALLQFTPVVSLAPPARLLLEIEGSLRLFGGARSLLGSVHSLVRRLGYTARAAVAPLPRAAEYLACAPDRDGCILDFKGSDPLNESAGAGANGSRFKGSDPLKSRSLAAALGTLPIAVLGQPEDEMRRLQGMGIRRLQDLLRLPRAALARRLGPALVADLDRAFGRLPDLRPRHEPPARHAAQLHLPAPVADVEALAFAARRLLRELCAALAARCAGVRRLDWTLGNERLALECAEPHHDAQRFLAVLRERLERTGLPAPIETLGLAATGFEPCQPVTQALLPRAPGQPAPGHGQLVERLQARLGARAVHGLAVREDHRPEYAVRRIQKGSGLFSPRSSGEPAGEEAKINLTPFPLQRPLWLLPEPLPLALAAGRPQWQGPLSLGGDPERIECGWWDGRPVARDYYVASNPHGARLWVFRELAAAGGWYLHGLFS